MMRPRSVLPGRRVGTRAGAWTGRELLARAGRLVLWLAVLAVVIRGAGDVLEVGARTTSSARAGRVVLPGWPDDAARALAVEFATAYLTHRPGDDPGAQARRLAGLAAPELSGQLAPRFDRRAPRQLVSSATVADVARLDARRALVTVAATVDAGHGDVRTRRLTVPVLRDRAGAPVVNELPSFAPAPARATVSLVQGEPLIGLQRAAITDVVTRYLRAYLAGDTGGLRYLAAPGARIAAAADRAQLLEPVDIAAAGSPVGNARVVLATVRARDPQSKASYALRYRLRLVRRERWYVAGINARDRSGERP